MTRYPTRRRLTCHNATCDETRPPPPTDRSGWAEVLSGCSCTCFMMISPLVVSFLNGGRWHGSPHRPAGQGSASQEGSVRRRGTAFRRGRADLRRCPAYAPAPTLG